MARYFYNSDNDEYWETMTDVAEDRYESETISAVEQRPDDLYDRVNGQWILDEVRHVQRQATTIRGARNYRLRTEVDLIASNNLRWNELTTDKRDAWAQYRLDLLNVPQQETFPTSVVWPTKPE